MLRLSSKVDVSSGEMKCAFLSRVELIAVAGNNGDDNFLLLRVFANKCK